MQSESEICHGSERVSREGRIDWRLLGHYSVTQVRPPLNGDSLSKDEASRHLVGKPAIEEERKRGLLIVKGPKESVRLCQGMSEGSVRIVSYWKVT